MPNLTQREPDREAIEIVAGDETIAAALRIAERYLIRLGWKHTPEEIGACARKLIASLVNGESS